MIEGLSSFHDVRVTAIGATKTDIDHVHGHIQLSVPWLTKLSCSSHGIYRTRMRRINKHH